MKKGLPSAHYIAIAAKDLREAAHYNICMRHHVNIQKVANRFIHNHRKIISVGKSTNPG